MEKTEEIETFMNKVGVCPALTPTHTSFFSTMLSPYASTPTNHPCPENIVFSLLFPYLKLIHIYNL